MREKLHFNFALSNILINLSEHLTTRTLISGCCIINPISLLRSAVAVALLIMPTIVFSQTSSTYPTDSYTPASLAPGAPAGSYSLNDIENINLFSGNLNINFPLVRIGGRGNAGYTISYPIENRWRIQDGYYPTGTFSGPPPSSAYAHHYKPERGWWTEEPGFGPGVMRSRRSSTFTGSCPGNQDTYYGGGQILTQMTFSGPGGTEMTFYDRRTGGAPAVYTAAHGCNIAPDGANRGNVCPPP